MAGPGATSIRSYNYFLDTSIANTAYVVNAPHEFLDAELVTPFTSHSIMISSDGGGDLFFSFDGVNDHGRVRTGEALQQDYRRVRRIWFRKSGADVPTRFWAW